MAQARDAVRAAADRRDRRALLFISPWAAQMAGQYTSKIEQRDDVSRVTPGVFGETAIARVFFVESVSGDSSAVQNIFVSSVHGTKSGVSMSRSGHTETAPTATASSCLNRAAATRARPAIPSIGSPSSTATPRASSSRRAGSHAHAQEPADVGADFNLPDPEPRRASWRIGIPISASCSCCSPSR